MNNAEIIYEGNVPVNQDPPALDAAIVATSAPMTAKEALLQIRLERLRQELLVDFQDEEPDLIDLKVTVALEEAVEKFPRHDAAVKAFRGAERQARAVLARICELLGAPGATPLKEELGEAQVAHGRWTSTLRPTLVASLAAAAESWYRPCNDPLEEVANALLKEFDAVEARVNVAKEAATPALPASSSNSGATKQEARLFDATTFVPVAFSGSGDPREVLGGYRTWRGAWLDAAKHMEEECLGTTSKLLLAKLQKTLEGTALDLVRSIPPETPGGYDEALKKLAARYDESVALAAAYLAPLHDGSGGSFKKRHEHLAEAFSHLKLLLPILEEERVSTIDFLIIQRMLPGMPATQRKDWEGHIVT